ncbi:Lrp/AsnC ligand binding domain-containing protein [Pseudogemmobacter bohemicus]|uniref:Lrp/AsnC ligand binding domain-containing protein n=1 Tax=Pseudogemmobacter bohemicus TaxID=2250708 RepID=UPI002FCD97B3
MRPKVRRVDDRLAGFERSIRDYSEVVDCWLMTGSFDYLLRVAVADLVEFETFLTGKLTKVPGVALIESSIPIRRVKTKLSRIS